MKKIIRYPKKTGHAETKSRRSHALIKNQNDIMLSGQYINALTRSAFELAGAHPYIFDTLAYICSHHRHAIERKNNQLETHYRVRVPIDYFKKFALDGCTICEKSLMTELRNLVSNQKPKVLPMTNEYSILTTPIMVNLVLKERSEVTPETIKRLSHLKNRKTGESHQEEGRGLPLKMVIIEFYKPLFASLFAGQFGNNWFPIPTAFHAKMIEEINNCRNLPEFQKINIKALPIQYRKLFLYMNLHDNSTGKKLILDATDTLLSCYPSLLSSKNGKHYINNWWKARLFVQKACLLFNCMAEKGLMDGAKFIPTKIHYNKSLRKFELTLTRQRKHLVYPA